MNDQLQNFMQQSKRNSEEQNQQLDQNQQNQLLQLNQAMAPTSASMFLSAPSPSPPVNYNVLSNPMAAAALLPGTSGVSGVPGVSNDSQVSSLGISNEIKRLQQLHQLGSAPANPLIGMSSQRQVGDPSSAILQSYLDHKVQATRLDDPLLQNLSTTRLLMNQSNLAVGLPQMPSRAAQALPSPHSLFHRDGSRRMRGGVIEPFPEKLHRLLLEVEASGRSDVISFVANGRAFSIHKPDKFFKEIVPLYFRQSRLSSFKRQLNLYGFELINTGPARGGYYHELFVKDRPEMCRKMRRVAVKVVSKRDGDGEDGDDGEGDDEGDTEKTGDGDGERDGPAQADTGTGANADSALDGLDGEANRAATGATKGAGDDPSRQD